MTVIIEFPCSSEQRDDFDRLRMAMAKMVTEEGDSLVTLMNAIVEAVKGYPVLTGCFACLAVAEFMLLQLPDMPVDERQFLRFRSFAVDVAEKMAATQAAAQAH